MASVIYDTGINSSLSKQNGDGGPTAKVKKWRCIVVEDQPGTFIRKCEKKVAFFKDSAERPPMKTDYYHAYTEKYLTNDQKVQDSQTTESAVVSSPSVVSEEPHHDYIERKKKNPFLWG